MAANVALARHALDAESRAVEWHVNLDAFGVDKLSLHRRAAKIIDAARPVGVSRADFLVFMTLRAILGLRTLRGEILAVDADFRSLIGPDADTSAAPRAEAEIPAREAGNARVAAIPDSAMREIAGAPRKAPTS